MALNKQVVPIDLIHGLETKDDAKVVVHGKLTVLENGEFDDDNTISKREGYSQITTTAVSGPAITAGRRLAKLGLELLLEASTGLYSLATSGSAAGVIRRTADFVRTSVGVRDLVRKNTSQHQQDIATVNSITCLVWQEGTGGTATLRYSVYDEATRTPYVADAELAATGLIPRVIVPSGQGQFFIYYISGANVVGRIINTATPATLGAATNLRTNAVSNTLTMDAIAATTIGIAAGYTYLVYRSTIAGNTLNAIAVSNTLTVDAELGIVSDASNPIALETFTSGRLGIFYNDQASAAVAVRTTDSPLTAVTAAVNIEAAATIIEGMTAVRSGANVLVAYHTGYTTGPSAGSAIIYTATVSGTPAIVTAVAALVRSAFIASRPFTVSSGTYFAVIFGSSGTAAALAVQPTLFILDIATGVVVARLLVSESGYSTATDTNPRITSVLVDLEETGAVTFPVRRRGALRIVNTVDETPIGLSRAVVRFTNTARPLQAVEFSDEVFFAGGCPLIYDGVGLFEAGFNYYPVLTIADGGAGSLSAGTYSVVGVYEWVDAKGVRHQSSPSVPVTITLAVNRSITTTFMTYRLTRRQSPRDNVRLVVYRTLAGGTTYYRAAANTGSTVNSLTVDSVAQTSTTSDADIEANEPLFTTGGGIEPEAFPPHRLSTVHQTRLFMAGTENPFAIRYTSELVVRNGLVAAETLELRVPQERGEITTLASLDDKLIVCCERGTYYFAGIGPNALGQQNGYSDAILVSEDVGCRQTSPDSIVLSPHGMWFRSEQGLRLLTRSLTIAEGPDGKPLGAEIDALLTGSVIAATLKQGKSQVLFFDGTSVWVFDYLWGQWSQWTNHAAVDAIEWNGLVVHMRAGGTIFQNGTANDAGTAIALRLETGWLKFAGVQGFQRVYELLALGTFVATSTLRVEVGSNYADAYTTPVTIDTSTIASATTPVQIVHRLATQKTEAVRFRISETGGTGGGFSLSNLSLLVGVKRSAFKLPATRRI